MDSAASAKTSQSRLGLSFIYTVTYTVTGLSNRDTSRTSALERLIGRLTRVPARENLPATPLLAAAP